MKLFFHIFVCAGGNVTCRFVDLPHAPPTKARKFAPPATGKPMPRAPGKILRYLRNDRTTCCE
jgi:hypothetical protein